MRRKLLLSDRVRERYMSMQSMTRALEAITTRLSEISERDGRQFLEDLVDELQQILNESPRRHSHAVRGGRSPASSQEHIVSNDKKG